MEGGANSSNNFCTAIFKLNGVKKMKQCDFYLLDFAYQSGVINNATPQSDVQVGNEYDFEITEVRAIINGAVDVTGGLFVDIILSGGVKLMENPVDMFSFASQSGAIADGNNGRPISVPWRGAIIPKASKVSALFTNSTGQTLSFQLILAGRKIFN